MTDESRLKTVKTLGGMLGGAVEAVALQPLDTVKTRLQLSTGNVQAFTIGRQILQQEGFLAFYKGLTPFVTHLVGKYALRFYANETYRQALKDHTSLGGKTMGFLAGLATGITEAVLIVTPFEVVKTRLQQQKGLDKSLLKYHGPVHCLKSVVASEGISALWKGVVPTMTRQGLNQCFLFGCYDSLKLALWGLERQEDMSPHKALVTGVVAGTIGPITNCPVDVAKTRLMADGAGQKYTGMFQTIRSVYVNEGAGALYKGLWPRVARVAPGQGITFMVMEMVCSFVRIDTDN